MSVSDWLEQFDFTAPAPAVAYIPPRPPGQAWVLRRWDRHEDGIKLFTDKGSALAELARHVRGSWDNLLGDDIPDTPSTDDRTAVDLYYGPDRDTRPEEGYALYADTISGRGRPRIVPLAFQFPDALDCERANRAAVFHAGTHGGLPCLEVDGILVFAYLNPRSAPSGCPSTSTAPRTTSSGPMTRCRCGSRSRTRSCSMTATQKARPGRRC
ncbi:hypothetical protein [Streptomyces sp900105755]|uniref:Uncharacterized protein n=1 Tax=Streptomyces sp. 900105755 TaxID=3154389 RepID=A0ABV1TV43_9ACTN